MIRIYECDPIGATRRLVAKDDSGAVVVTCHVSARYVQSLVSLLSDLDPDTEWDTTPPPLDAGERAAAADAMQPGMVRAAHPITGEALTVPFFMLDARRGTYQPGATPMLRRICATAEDAHERRKQQGEELRALLERLSFLTREVEADWREASAHGDRDLARQIRWFELEDLRRAGLWVAPSARKLRNA